MNELRYPSTHPNYDYEVLEDDTIRLNFYKGKVISEVLIPFEIDCKTVSEIGSNCFYRKGIEKIVIPHTCRKIYDNAFEENHLTEIEIPTDCKFNLKAFTGNKGLRKIHSNNKTMSVKLDENSKQLFSITGDEDENEENYINTVSTVPNVNTKINFKSEYDTISAVAITYRADDIDKYFKSVKALRKAEEEGTKKMEKIRKMESTWHYKFRMKLKRMIIRFHNWI